MELSAFHNLRDWESLKGRLRLIPKILLTSIIRCFPNVFILVDDMLHTFHKELSWNQLATTESNCFHREHCKLNSKLLLNMATTHKHSQSAHWTWTRINILMLKEWNENQILWFPTFVKILSENQWNLRINFYIFKYASNKSLLYQVSSSNIYCCRRTGKYEHGHWTTTFQ